MNIIRKYKLHKNFGVPLSEKEKDIISFFELWLNNLIKFNHTLFPNNIYYMRSDDGRWVLDYDKRTNTLNIRLKNFWDFLLSECLFNNNEKDSIEFLKYFINIKVEILFNHIYAQNSNMVTNMVEADFKKVLNEYYSEA